MRNRQRRRPTREDFEDWVEAFRGPLVGLLASWGPDWRAAEELAMDTLAEAWVSRSNFRGDPADLDAVGAWVRGIAFHLHTAALRKAGNSRLQPLEPEQIASEEVESDERRELLAEAFATLNDSHQTILRMFYLDETSAFEVAALLGITSKAVERRLYQARKALRDRLNLATRQTVQEVSQ